MAGNLPFHLKKYIVEQDYEKYTPRDHAVWRYILRQLKNFLGTHAHESYLEGLQKTGIEIEQIPRIENISAHLEKFGWRALPVSGFIPPAAFMELQSLNILPIASDMRSLDHLLYTPAPDIVHEAAGHAPIIANEEYAAYLREYAQVAKKAIISKEDLEVYKAIRELSDLKEVSGASPDDIKAAEERLEKLTASVSYVSEATELSRMNWWTAEYGLIGDIRAPKIFGAGLLSSVGEAQWCLSEKVKKIPLSLDCIRQSYDITEPQPQLFVARDFKHLSEVLNELAETMSFKTGGVKSLERARRAESVNTVELENGLQISGVLAKYYLDSSGNPAYLSFAGPTQICFQGRQIPGHGNDYHAEGYGTPLGKIKKFSDGELVYESGVTVRGILKKDTDNRILSFENATCTFNDEVLFRPEWGTYDVVIGNQAVSVFGGPADRVAFGEVEDFVAKRVGKPVYSENEKKVFSFYRDLRSFRNLKDRESALLMKKFSDYKTLAADEWLLFVEILEIAVNLGAETGEIESHLRGLAAQNTQWKPLIEEGMKLAYARF